MRKILKFFIIFLTIVPSSSLPVACVNGGSNPKTTITDQDVVNAIVKINQNMNWNLTVDKIGFDNIIESIKKAIKKQLTKNILTAFNQGQFTIYQFSKLGTDNALSHNYFLNPHEKSTLVFNFKFNTIVADASINININNNVIDQDVVDAIKLLNQNNSFNVAINQQDSSGLEQTIAVLKNEIGNKLEDPLKTYFNQGQLTINSILDQNKQPINDTYFIESHQQKQFSFPFVFNTLEDQTTFNLTVLTTVTRKQVSNDINNLPAINIVMNRNFENGLNTLKLQLVNNIENSLLNESYWKYLSDNNFKITQILKDGNAIDNSYFHIIHHQGILQFKYEINNIEEVISIDFNLTVKRGNIINDDITSALQAIKDIPVEVNANLTGGLVEAKNNITDAIIKQLSKEDQKIAVALKDKILVITKILKDGKAIDDNYFATEKASTQLIYEYSFDNNIVGKNTTKLQVLAKKQDQDVINAINNIINFNLIEVNTTDTSSGLINLKTIIKNKISQALLQENSDETLKAAFDEGFFTINNIEINNKIIDSTYFNQGQLEQQMTINYQFGTISKQQSLSGFILSVEENDKNVSDVVKTIFPNSLVLSMENISVKQVKQLLIDDIYQKMNNKSLVKKATISQTFNNNYQKKLKIGSFTGTNVFDKKIEITKFSAMTSIFLSDIEFTVSYGSFTWTVNQFSFNA